MSKIKELKNDVNNSLNLISVLELFSPEKKSKYTDLLLRLMTKTKNLKEHVTEIKKSMLTNFEFINEDELNEFNDIQIMWIYRFIDTFFNVADLNNFRKFCDYNERGLIEQNDLSRYKSFDEVINQTGMADMKVEEKELENQIIKIYEDSEWLLIKPLTHKASRKYGSNTKWCTTQENNTDYFFKYTKRGVLVYSINKKNGYKVASFYSQDKNEPEFSYWNQKDARIDSTESELPINLIQFIREHVKDPKVKSNNSYLEQYENDTKRGGKSRMGRRIEQAVKRGAEELNAVQEIAETCEIQASEPMPCEQEEIGPQIASM